MRKVILLRHAKSSWADAALGDHDRPLNKRGKAAAPVIGAWLARNGHRPDLVLCSSSVRTCETVRRMKAGLSDLPDPVIEAELYHASPMTMSARLRALPDDVMTVMLVGHQPGLGSLARQLADGTESSRCSQAFTHFPTAAAAILTLGDVVWSSVGPGTARLVDFARPRDLMDDNR